MKRSNNEKRTKLHLYEHTIFFKQLTTCESPKWGVEAVTFGTLVPRPNRLIVSERPGLHSFQIVVAVVRSHAHKELDTVYLQYNRLCK